jgi:integrase
VSHCSTTEGFMTATFPYIRDRDGVFQYERRVPLRIRQDRDLYEARFRSRPLFRRSLRTKHRQEAMLAYEKVDREFERLLESRHVAPVEQRRSAPTRMVTDHDLAAIAERYAQLTAEPFETLHRRANVDAAAAADLARLEHDLELDAEAIRSAIRSREADPDAIVAQPMIEADHLIAEHQFFAPEGSELRGAIIGAVRSGLEQGYRRITALGQGDLPPMLGAAVAPLKPANLLTLADAVSRYLEARRPPVKAVSETQLALRQFEQVVGRKAIAAVTRDDAHRFIEYLSNQKVGGKTVGSVVRHLSEQSIGKRVRLLARAINHARDRGVFEGENVLSGIKVGAYTKQTDIAVMPTKRRLQVTEINAVLSHPWFTGCASATDIYNPGNHRLDGAEYWVPIVALFTGCRAGELGGLKLNEVVLDGPHPHFIIRNNEYRRTKSKRARCVPILDALAELGFADYVKRIFKGGHDRVFPDWTAHKRKGGGENDYPAWSNSGVIRAFNRQVIPATLGDKLPPDVRREVTFHSMRGAFKAMLAATNKVPAIIVNEVVGHAQDEMNERYIGEINIEDTYPAVKACRYPSLVVPSILQSTIAAAA